MKRYALMFTAAYCVLTLAVAGLGYAFNLGGSAGLNLVVTLTASFFAASRFASEEGRLPTDSERKRYAWGALAGALLSSLVMVAAALGLLVPAQEILAMLKFFASGYMPAAFAAGLLVMSAFYYLAIRWSFSWYAKRACPA